MNAHTDPAPSRSSDDYVSLITTPVRSLLKRAPVTLPPQTPIIDAARLMREHRISSVLIVQDGALFGLITDRDLRNRVVAAGLDTSRPILEIATLAPLTIDIQQHAFDALLLMARHNIHHMPVLDGQAVAGMISSSDLSERQSNSAVYLAGAIYNQDSVQALVQTSARIKQLQQSLAAAEASAYSTGHIVSAITDALTARLLQLGEMQLGPAPLDYAWVAAGSQGRNEQTAKSDQDNCMVLDDGYEPERHGEYFKQLSRFVCDGLDACGYVHCPGEMMAMTDLWRQPLQQWRQYFYRWIDIPEPEALMLTGVFFDQRFVYGKPELIDGLRAEVVQRSRGNKSFLVNLAGNALQRQPPLNWLGNISLIKGGAHEGCVDLKMQGIVPITDMARFYALAAGSAAVNTRDRLEIAAGSGAVTAQQVRDLIDALEFLSTLRLQHQAQRMSEGHAADNYLRPDALSNLERGHLKNAFAVVKSVQGSLARLYPVNQL
jgi:CBS domain-containing protein